MTFPHAHLTGDAEQQKTPNFRRLSRLLLELQLRSSIVPQNTTGRSLGRKGHRRGNDRNGRQRSNPEDW